MLLIKLRNDGGLTIVSDDKHAENARIEDVFRGQVEEVLDEESDEMWEEEFPTVSYEVLEAWRKAPFDGGTLEVEFKPEHSKEILDALEEGGFEIDDDIYRAVNPPVERRPKPSRS